MKFEQFIDLIAPVFANNAAEINDFVLRSTFDRLFDQNSNGTIEQEEFESLLTLLRAFNTNKNDLEKKNLLYENLRKAFANCNNHISFKGKINFK
jgi:folate-dependent tRNA-U54 methylase TrmFO/GidA